VKRRSHGVKIRVWCEAKDSHGVKISVWCEAKDSHGLKIRVSCEAKDSHGIKIRVWCEGKDSHGIKFNYKHPFCKVTKFSREMSSGDQMDESIINGPAGTGCAVRAGLI